MLVGTAKESYRADQGLLTNTAQKVWMALFAAGLLLLPFVGSNYMLYLACLVMVNITSAMGLNILTGYTGLVSLGHAAFMAVGAYTVGILERDTGLPFFLTIPLAGIVAAAIGMVFGIPSLRVKGLYLAIATIGASVILTFVFLNWSSMTGGSRGLSVAPATLGSLQITQYHQLYWIVMPVCVALVLAAANLFRTRVGRAFIAIRDRDISAEVLGIPLLKYKLMSFAVSSFYAGVAGGMWAYMFRAVGPESFTLVHSIFFLAAIIVGGMGTILGAVLGAIFMTMVPELLRILVDLSQPFVSNAQSLFAPVRTIVFGALIILFLVFEPQGLAEILARIRRLWHLWPFRK